MAETTSFSVTVFWKKEVLKTTTDIVWRKNSVSNKRICTRGNEFPSFDKTTR